MLAQNSPASRHYIRVVNCIGWSLVIFLGIFGELSAIDVFIAEYATGKVGTAAYSLISSVFYMAPFIAAGLIFFLMNRRVSTVSIAFTPRLTPDFPLLILAGLAVITAAAHVNSWFCDLIGYSIPPEMITESYDDPSTVIMYMTVALAPAFAEEFLFRGVIYGNLRPFGKTQAILISSALFALMHQNIGQFFYTFIGGIAMAVMYEVTGSIWCSIFYHMLNNQMAVLTEVLYYGKYGEAITPLLTLWDILLYALGFVSLCILVLRYRSKKKREASLSARPIYGDNTASPEAFDRPVDRLTLLKGLRTPGMIVFVALALVSAITTFMIIRFIDLGELLG